MTAVIKLGLEVVGGALVDVEQVETDAVKLFELAEAVYDQPDSLQVAVNARTGLYEQRVTCADNEDIALTVRAQKAKKSIHGIGLVFATLGIHEGSDEMYISLFRDKLKKYKFEKDPYVEMFSSIFRQHLETVKCNQSDSLVL